MSTLGIQDVGLYVPDDGLDSFQVGEGLEASAEFIENKLGFRTLKRKVPGEECSDLCMRAYEDLASRDTIDLASVDCIVVVTQNPDGGGIPHSSAILHRKLELAPAVACFDVSLGCSGYVHGLSIISGFLRENSSNVGLLFTADPYSRIIDSRDRDTVLLFGDAASCTIVSCNWRYRLGKTCYLTDGRWAEAIQLKERSGSLRMNGHQVFRFVARQVVDQVWQCLQSNGCTIEDIDLFLVHQGSKYIVDTLAASLNIPGDKIPFAAEETGNTVSTSLPLLLTDQLSTPLGARTILMSGFGVGLASATTILHRHEEN
jgi:3-oxoacyl-[acyl-carrier-protein] synthase-3